MTELPDSDPYGPNPEDPGMDEPDDSVEVNFTLKYAYDEDAGRATLIVEGDLLGVGAVLNVLAQTFDLDI